MSSAHSLSRLQALTHSRHAASSRSIHPYFGKVDPAIVRAAIEQFSIPGECVLDPFCGSGTVVHEALLMQRRAIGWDSSPLAVLLATAKVTGIANQEAAELVALSSEVSAFSEARGLFSQMVPDHPAPERLPRVHDITSWFQPNAFRELCFLRALLAERRQTMSVAAGLLARIAFSRIIVTASNQQGESSYRRVTKPDTPGRVVGLFEAALKDVGRAAAQFAALAFSEIGSRTGVTCDVAHSTVSYDATSASIFLHDSRLGTSPSKQESLVDLVVTSPPYLMSWDYGLYHKFRFYWLDYDLDSYEETEIGRHLRRKKDDVQRYKSDMSGAFRSLATILSPSGHVVMINAPSVVYGKMVDTNEILAECAAEAGLHFEGAVQSLDIPGPHHGMYASLDARDAVAPGEKGKKEHVLLFSRRA